MLNILRNLRRNSINTKYLKYAFGEIILVVVGILIALWINNWNEERKNNIIRHAFLSSLQQDLQADTTYLGQIIEQLKLENEGHEEFKTLVNEEGTNKSNLIKIVKSSLNPFVPPFNGFNNDTYRAFSNSGRLELIDSELQKDLFRLDAFQELTEKDADRFVNIYFDKIGQLQLPLDINIQLLDDGPLVDEIWNSMDLVTMSQRLNAWGSSKKNYFRITISNLEQAKKLTNEILAKHF